MVKQKFIKILKFHPTILWNKIKLILSKLLITSSVLTFCALGDCLVTLVNILSSSSLTSPKGSLLEVVLGLATSDD